MSWTSVTRRRRVPNGARRVAAPAERELDFGRRTVGRPFGRLSRAFIDFRRSRPRRFHRHATTLVS